MATTRRWAVPALLGTGLTLAAPWAVPGALPPAWAQAPATPPTDGRVALVVSGATYQQAPSVPECGEAAKEVAAKLRAAGYEVLESHDGTTPALQGSLDAFSRRAASQPGKPTVLYVCARAVVDVGRLFILPPGTVNGRTVDLATQAVLAKAFIRAQPEAGGLLAMELHVDGTSASLAPALQALRNDTAGKTGVAAAVTAGTGTTALTEQMRQNPTQGNGNWQAFALDTAARPGGNEVLFVPVPAPRDVPVASAAPAGAGDAAVAVPAPGVASGAVPGSVVAGAGAGGAATGAGAGRVVIGSAAPSTAGAAGSGVAGSGPAGADGAASGAEGGAAVAGLPLPPPEPPPAPEAPPVQVATAAPVRPVVPAPSRPAQPAVARPVPSREARPPARPVEVISEREQRLRAALAARGFGRGAGDSRAGMEAAVRSFQRSVGRTATGQLTGNEVLMLMNGG